jgi:hypothetical protein
MPARRTLLLGAVCTPLALDLPASAADASALTFANDIHIAYKGKDAKVHPLDSERAVRGSCSVSEALQPPAAIAKRLTQNG